MDSKKERIIDEISTAVENLSLKIEALQAKVDELCKTTGECATIDRLQQAPTPPRSPTKKKVPKL